MPKKYKFLVYAAIFFLIAVIGYLIVKNLSSPPQGKQTGTGQASSTLPDLLLTEDQETWVRQFVKNFVNLYNTYSYSDYSNLTALGDYQTPQMQQKTLDLIEQLKASTQPGFSVSTVVNENSFSFRYPDSSQLVVTEQAQATESSTSYSAQNSQYKITATLVLAKSGDHWLVSDIKITKNN